MAQLELAVEEEQAECAPAWSTWGAEHRLVLLLAQRERAVAVLRRLVPESVAACCGRALIKQKETECKARLDAQTGAVEAAAALVPTVWRRAYDAAKSRAKRAPYVVPMDDHRCGGCRLRLSNEVAEGARHGGKPVQCDSCGRVVYFSL